MPRINPAYFEFTGGLFAIKVHSNGNSEKIAIPARFVIMNKLVQGDILIPMVWKLVKIGKTPVVDGEEKIFEFKIGRRRRKRRIDGILRKSSGRLFIRTDNGEEFSVRPDIPFSFELIGRRITAITPIKIYGSIKWATPLTPISYEEYQEYMRNIRIKENNR